MEFLLEFLAPKTSHTYVFPFLFMLNGDVVPADHLTILFYILAELTRLAL